MQRTRLPGLPVVVAAYAAGSLWLWLQPRFPPLTPSTGLTGRSLIAFLLPTAAAVLLWVFHIVESRRPVCIREPGDIAATERIVLRFVVFICGLHALVLSYLTETALVQRWAPQLALGLVGILLVSVGNLLPKTRPNALVGIRTARSLGCREFWIEINRVGGYVSVALGVVSMVAAVSFGNPLVGHASSFAVLAAIAILVGQYRALARGTGDN